MLYKLYRIFCQGFLKISMKTLYFMTYLFNLFLYTQLLLLHLQKKSKQTNKSADAHKTFLTDLLHNELKKVLKYGKFF